MDQAGIHAYFLDKVESITREVELMSKLKGNSNIVSYEDHQVIEHADKMGWDILIRMELLQPLVQVMKTRSMARRDVIQIGIDICRALELCHKFHIVHRDIKIDNIFLSENGDWKLGDFGIANRLNKLSRINPERVHIPIWHLRYIVEHRMELVSICIRLALFYIGY